ncbi:MAG: branched-chain amino acid ABC transporter permease [Fimbriimonas sp.]
MKFWSVRIGSILAAVGFCFLLDVLARTNLGSYGQRILVLIGIYITLAVSLNLINGITGQFSIGHAAFYQVGAYLAGYMSLRYLVQQHHAVPAIPWLIGMMMLGAAGAAIAGLIVGLPSLRLRGDYLAIVTLGFGEIIRIIVQNTKELGGSYALDKIPKIQPIWLVWLLAIICVATCRNLIKTARGLTFLAVREDEVASSAMGVNVTRVKVTAFVIGSAFAGAAGALLAHYEGLITPTTFAMDVSFIILTMVVLGGTGSITGSIVAALFLTYLQEYLRGLKAANGADLAISGNLVVAGLLATIIAVVAIKRLMESHWGTPTKRGLIYVAIIVVAVIGTRFIAMPLHAVKTLAQMSVPAGQLRMVIFAVTLVVLMLLRPQGIFGHHEFSWSWLQRLFGKKGPTAGVAS